jgi:predicted enzyme related to lactoylglutathione lyase
MFEFIAVDQEKLCAFYAEVFGWDYRVSGGFAYIDFPDQQLTPLGGIGQAQPDTPGWEPGCHFYLATDDVEGTLDAVVAAGGTRYVDPQTVDGYTFAMFKDPEGNVVGLLLTGRE